MPLSGFFTMAEVVVLNTRCDTVSFPSRMAATTRSAIGSNLAQFHHVVRYADLEGVRRDWISFRGVFLDAHLFAIRRTVWEQEVAPRVRSRIEAEGSAEDQGRLHSAAEAYSTTKSDGRDHRFDEPQHRPRSDSCA